MLELMIFNSAVSVNQLPAHPTPKLTSVLGLEQPVNSAISGGIRWRENCPRCCFFYVRIFPVCGWRSLEGQDTTRDEEKEERIHCERQSHVGSPGQWGLKVGCQLPK